MGGPEPAAGGAVTPGAGIRPPGYAVVLFLALAGLWTAVAWMRGVEHLSSDQHMNLALVLKGTDPSLFPRDLMFDQESIAHEYIPLYIGYLRAAFLWTADLAAGYKLLVLPLNLIYLFGSYALLARYGLFRGLATALAMLASLPLAVPVAGELFGIGPLQAMTARMLVTAPFPFLFLAFWAWLDRPGRLLGVFLALGLLANLHPPSGLFVAPMLALTYLLERRGALGAWGLGLAMGGATALGAAPILWTQLQRLASQTAGVARAGDALIGRLMVERLGYLLYPPYTLEALPRGAVHGLTLLIAAGSVLCLVQAWRTEAPGWWLGLRAVAILALGYMLYPELPLLCLLLLLGSLAARREAPGRGERLAVYFTLAIFWVSVGGVLALQGIFALLGRPVLLADVLRGVRFAGFALFPLLALTLQNLEWARMGRFARVAVVLVLVGLAAWQVRHVTRTYLRTRGDVAAADLASLARWAREETAPPALFLFDSPGFRVMARRSAAFITKDGPAAIYHRPDRAAAWVERQQGLRRAGGDAEALRAEALRVGAEYLVVASGRVPARLLPLLRYRNGSYAVLAAGS